MDGNDIRRAHKNFEEVVNATIDGDEWTSNLLEKLKLYEIKKLLVDIEKILGR